MTKAQQIENLEAEIKTALLYMPDLYRMCGPLHHIIAIDQILSDAIGQERVRT